jgi:putative oxidoreductase
MNLFKRLFLSIQPIALDLGLLIIRLSTGGLLMQYGFQKMQKFGEFKSTFPDPFGLGSELSLVLCIFAEFFCSLLLALGLFTRLVLIPLIINMLVVVFFAHANDPFSQKEHGLSFLFPHILIFLTGPGRFSLDALLFNKKAKTLSDLSNL